MKTSKLLSAIALLCCASGCGRFGFAGGDAVADADIDGSSPGGSDASTDAAKSDAAKSDAAKSDAAPSDAAPSDAAPSVTVVAELLDDTNGDELVADWWFNELQAITSFPGDSRWVFTCSGGGSSGGSWTVDITKANADACVAKIASGPVELYPVQYVSGPALTNPMLWCGSNKQVSLRADEGEMYTLHPVHTSSFEGQWCNGVVSSGTSPTSSHRLEVTSL